MVDDAAEAYRISTAHGGVGVRPPVTLRDAASGQVGVACGAGGAAGACADGPE